MKYEIQTLSPLNIGDGRKYKEFEYLYKDERVNYIDIMKLIRDNSHNKALYESIISSMDSPRFRWNEALKYTKIDLMKYVHYSVKADTITSLRGEIISFGKTAGRPYVPGSSIKGALRSAVTRNLWARHGQHYKNVFFDSQYRFSGGQGRRAGDDRKLKVFDDYVEEAAFGKPHNSPFRFLKIWDSAILSYDNLGIYEMKIENICNGKAKWYNRNFNHEDIKSALPIYVEAISPGSLITGECSLDKVIKDDYLTGAANIKNKDIFNNLIDKIKEDNREYINGEIRFFEKYGPPEVKNFYLQMNEMLDSLKSNEIMLQMGFGTGYLSKTVGCFMNSEELGRLSKMGMRVADVSLFPKTRRIMLKKGRPHSVPGWVKIKFADEAED